MITLDVKLCCTSNLQSATPNKTVTLILNAVKILNLATQILHNLNKPSMNTITFYYI